MKKATVKILSLILALLTMSLVLVSCGGEKISGEYISEGDMGKVELTFNGNKISYKRTDYTWTGDFDNLEKVVDEVAEYEITYKLEDGKITCYADKMIAGFAYIMDGSTNKYFYEQDFEQGDDYIKIGKSTYQKK